VLDRAGRLTPGALRASIVRAVMEVAPEKARERREKAARSAEVQQWAEFSGNAALAGRELPPADVLAAGQRIDSRAAQLKSAGLQGSTGELRARALMDLLLGRDSRPDNAAASGMGPGAFAATVNLTIPLATLLDLADRPGEIPGIGPIDPWLARDLARTAVSNPKSTWCVTVTDRHGHAIGHGCARPAPRGRQKGPGPPGFTFVATDRRGPPGGYGTWRLRTSGDGRDLTVTLDPLSTRDCDHRYQARGHDPGARLRHLSQIRHATCTGPCCRRPSARADFEHNVPYEAGGRTCLCNGDAGGLFATRCGWSVILVVVRASVPVRSRFSRLRPQNRVRDVDACGAVAGAGSGGRGGDPGEVRGPAGAAGGGGAGPAGAVDGR